jgi:membrane dipeptidase
MLPIFDGHNDFLLRLIRPGADRGAIWRGALGGGHLDLPRMRAGGMMGGMFAVFLPSPESGDPAALDRLMEAPPYDLPLPPPLALDPAQVMALAMVGHLHGLVRDCPDEIALCRSVPEIRAAAASGRIAAVLHMEGAEAVGADLDALYLFHALGLRSLGPVWSRPNAFGHGVPFRYPADPDTGPGLTGAGRRLARACAELRIVVDISHLNAAGVRDLAALSDAPLIATHSNAHAVCPHARNLTDWQLDLIAERDGMVGLNFATAFLDPDGRRRPDLGWDPVLRHLDHLIGRLGEDRVGLGSDFDGAQIPDLIGDAAGLPRLMQALADHGFGPALCRKIACDNWLAALGRVWGGSGARDHDAPAGTC